MDLLITIFKFSVLISNKVNIDKYKPHKQKLFGILTLKSITGAQNIWESIL